MSCMVMRRLIALSIFPILALCTGDLCLGQEGPSDTASITSDEITSLIRDLGNPSYERRTDATRRLCMIGMRVRAELEAASKGDDVEIALRAKRLLTTLDRLWFTGVEVVLSFSRPATAWDQPIDLLITATNRSEHPARIPFAAHDDADGTGSSDARQVGVMLDVADFIEVRAADGQEIELRVDDIQADPAVAKAVQQRLEAEPSTVLEPGRQMTIQVRAFNRGWARYPLLDRGTYTAVLVYEPAWDDDVLRTRHVGRVVSNEAAVRVESSAPQAVSRGGQEVSLAVERRGPFLIAELTNRTDQPMLVNKNFGAASPFAVGLWVYTYDQEIIEAPVDAKPWSGWHDFDAALLVEALPGESVELARIQAGELLKTLAEKGADLEGDDWTVHFSYASFCDRFWQRRQGSALLGNDSAPKIFQTPLSRRILSSRHASTRLRRAGQ